MICSRFYWDSFIIPKIRSLTKRACIRISSGSETASSSCSWEAASTVFSKAAIGDCPWGLGNAVEPFSYLNKRGQIQSDISLYSSNKNHGIELNMKHTQTQWDDSIDEWDKAGFFAEYFRNGSGGKGRVKQKWMGTWIAWLVSSIAMRRACLFYDRRRWRRAVPRRQSFPCVRPFLTHGRCTRRCVCDPSLQPPAKASSLCIRTTAKPKKKKKN